MASVKFRIKKQSANSNIYVVLSLGRGKVFERKTGFSVDSKDWNKENGLPKQNIDRNKQKANLLRKLEIHLHEKINDEQANGGNINSKWLQDEIDYFFDRKSRSGHNQSILYWIEQYWINAPSRANKYNGGLGIAKKTISRYKGLHKLFAEYQGNKDYQIKDLSKNFMEDFQRYLIKEKNYSVIYLGKTMAHFRAVFNAAKEYVDVPSDFFRYEIPKEKDKVRKIVLTPEELKKIQEADIRFSYLDNARKWLLLGCDIGARVNDLLNLTEANIQVIRERDGTLTEVFQYMMTKGPDEPIQVPIFKNARKVIESGFPHKISATNLNLYIKEVCRLAGIDEMVTDKLNNPKTRRKEVVTLPKYRFIQSHTFRRTFCTNLRQSTSDEKIMSFTGHKDLTVFLNYIGKKEANYGDLRKNDLI